MSCFPVRKLTFYFFDFRPPHYGSVADSTVTQLNKPGIYEEMAHFSSIPGIRK